MQDAVQRWGFQFALDGSGSGSDVNDSQRDTTVHVLAVPVICGRQLQPQDVPHFIGMEWNGALSTAADLPQPVQSILQSVACRSAIMFGDQLKHDHMCKVLAQLQLTKAPFHCAHGRPTTAPLVDVGSLQQGSDVRQQAARMKAGSVSASGKNASSLKQRLKRQLTRCQPLELTLCLARDCML